MSENKVCGIVVTFNRKNLLLKQIIEIVERQKYSLDGYYIIDNASTDGTDIVVADYIKSNPSRTKIVYIRLDSNIGGAGGFQVGLKKAFDDKYDWFYLMDDDGRPYDDLCIKQIIQHMSTKNYRADGLYMLNSLVQCDSDLLSFGLGHYETIEECYNISAEGVITGKINPFNGTMLSRGLIKRIGYPNKDFFIKGDEQDYEKRARKIDAHIETVMNSHYYHPRSNGYTKHRVLGKEMYVYIETSWKEYYSVRNHTYSALYFNDKIGALFFLLKRIYCCFVCECDKLKVLEMIFKGFIDGLNGKLGKTVNP